MKFLLLSIAAALFLPSFSWFEARPTGMRGSSARIDQFLNEGLFAEEVGIAAEKTEQCAEIEISFDNWINSQILDGVIEGMNWTLTVDERADMQEIREEHMNTVNRIISQYLEVLPVQRRDPTMGFHPTIMITGNNHSEIYQVFEHITAYQNDRAYVGATWKLISNNSEQIVDIFRKTERMKKYVWVKSVAERVEFNLGVTLRELLHNGRFSQELLDSIQPTFVSLVEDWDKSLLNKYYQTAASVVTAQPLGRRNQSMWIEMCFPDALNEVTLYELSPIGFFDKDNYQWPLIPRFGMSDEKEGKLIPIWDMDDCKSMGPVRLCKWFEDPLQISSCSLYKEERANGCPHDSEVAEDEEFSHVTPTVTGYVVSTRATKVFLITDKKEIPQRTPLTSSAVHITVPFGSTVKIGQTTLHPRNRRVDVPFSLKELPVQEPTGNVPKAKVLNGKRESVIIDVILLITGLLIILSIGFLILHYRSGWKTAGGLLATHDAHMMMEMEEIRDESN